MTAYAEEIERISKADTLEEIRRVAAGFPATAKKPGGILYSGKVGGVNAEAIALELAKKTGLPIVNRTPRAKFLIEVEAAIRASAERIFRLEGQDTATARQSAASFLYGNSRVPPDSPISVKNCLWGTTSQDFASSLRGDITVVASAADAERVLAQVEVPAALKSEASSLGGRPIGEVRMLLARGGINAVLPVVQAQFVDSVTKGIFNVPNQSGPSSTRVWVSKEAASALGLDSTRFVSSAHLVSAGLLTAPETIRVAAPDIEPAGSVASEASARGSFRPGIASGAAVVAAVAVLYDVATSADKAAGLWEQGNHTAASSEVLHFGARNLGMWGGAVLGAEVFGAAGAETGPWDLVVSGAGALVGAFAGDRLADAMDRQRIYHQRGPDGRVWTYDPEDPARGWTRTTSELDTGATRLNDGFPVYRESGETADAALSDRLNYQASGDAVELALAHPPRQKDPYTQPAAPGDTHSVRDAPWSRDPRTHVWTRRVVDGLLEHGMVSAHVERATATRAAALDRAAEDGVAENAAHSRESVALRYQSAYREFGWEKYGPPPESVAEALRTMEAGIAPSDHANAAGAHAFAERTVASPALVPAHLLDFRQAGHPLHAFYERAVAKVHDMEDRYQVPYGLHSERLAAALTDAVAAYNVGKRPGERFGTLERIELQGEGADRRAVAVDQRVNYHLPQVQVSVPVDKAVGRSVEQSSHDWARRHMPHLQEATRAREANLALPESRAWPACDLRCPDNPRHAQFEALRGKVVGAYADAGIFRSRTQLDETTAAVLPHLAQGRVDPDATRLSLLADPQTGVIGPLSDLLVQQDYGTLGLRTRIPSEQLQALPDQAFHWPAQAAQQDLPGREPQQAQAR